MAAYFFLISADDYKSISIFFYNNFFFFFFYFNFTILYWLCHISTASFILIQPVHSEGDQPWDFFGRNDAKAETPVLWPPHAKSWLIGKDSDAGRDCGQEEKGTAEDEMAGWHHWLDGRESEWTPGAGDGQGGLVCCDSWDCTESDMNERLIWSDLILLKFLFGYIFHSVFNCNI